MSKRNVILLSLFLLAVAAFFYVELERNKRESELSASNILHSQQALEQANALAATLLDIESEVRGYVITANPIFLRDLDNDKQRLYNELRATVTFFGKDRSQQPYLDSLERLISAKMALQDSIVQAYRVSQAQALQLIASLRGLRQTNSIRYMLNQLLAQERNSLEDEISQSRYKVSHRYNTIGWVVFACLLLLAVALWMVNWQLRLRRRAELETVQKEKTYQNLIENSSVVMFTADEKGFFSFVSSNAADLTGYSKDELLGKHYTSLLRNDWKERVMAHYQDQRKNLVQETLIRFPIVTRDGRLKWVDQNTVLLLEGSNVTGFQSIVTDVTDKKLSEDLVRDAEQNFQAEREDILFRLQAILDYIPMIVYIKDLQGKFILTNKLFSEIYAIPGEDIIGHTIESVENENAKTLLYHNTDQEVITSHRIIEFEDKVMTKNGERHMLVTKFPLFDKEQKLFGVCGIDKDITDMVVNREQLLAAKQKAEKAEQLQEEFLANMSHEIRTPMNGIVGMANLLMETPLAEEQKEYVRVISQSSDLLLALLNDILDLSKIKAGKMEVEERNFALQSTINTAIAPIRHKLNKDVVFTVDMGPDLPEFVSGDVHKLSQILNNLLSNAAKFTHRGEVRVQVQTASHTGNTVTLQFIVSDTGIGIAQENLDRVFDAFSQGGKDMVRKFGGTGLGLAITKRLVELQGGNISMQSQVGVGKIFYFHLPYKIAFDSEPADSDKEQTTNLPSDIQGRRILVVEDNPVNQKVVVSILQNRGVICTVAGNGREAVSLLEENRNFDAILMDLQMPEMDGFQTTTYIRQKLKCTTPIIAMTASALRNEKARCFEVGMNEYLTKPFAPAALVQHLHRIIHAEEKGVENQASSGSEGLYSMEHVAALGDKEVQTEILTMFLESAPQLLQQLKEAELHSQWEDAYKAAHELKSTVGILQATGMLEKCSGIELAVKEKRYEAVSPLVKKLLEEFVLIREMIEAEREELNK